VCFIVPIIAKLDHIDPVFKFAMCTLIAVSWLWAWKIINQFCKIVGEIFPKNVI